MIPGEIDGSRKLSDADAAGLDRMPRTPNRQAWLSQRR